MNIFTYLKEKRQLSLIYQHIIEHKAFSLRLADNHLNDLRVYLLYAGFTLLQNNSHVIKSQNDTFKVNVYLFNDKTEIEAKNLAVPNLYM